MSRFLLPAVLCVWIAGSGAARAAEIEIKIIVNGRPKATQLSVEQVQRVFLLKTNSLPDGSRVEPVLGRGSPAYGIFLKHCMGRTDAALNTYYRSLVFTGRALMPKFFDSDAEVIAYVARTKGALGYVSANANAEGLQLLTLK
jgi:hypothetical protein